MDFWKQLRTLPVRAQLSAVRQLLVNTNGTLIHQPEFMIWLRANEDNIIAWSKEDTPWDTSDQTRKRP